MDISQYEAEAVKDFSCDLTSINAYCLKLGHIQAKWAKYIHKEEQLLNVLESEMDMIYKDLTHFYTYDYEFKLDKKQIETYVLGDKEYTQKKREYNAQKSLIKYLNDILKALGNQSYYLNTCVKHLMWQAGE